MKQNNLPLDVMQAAEAVHKTFCEETGQSPRYQVHERAIFQFLTDGYTADDLRLVLRHLQRENRQWAGSASHSLRIDRLLDFDHRRFDSILSEARACARNRRPAPTAKQQALEQLRPTIDPEKTSTMTQGGARPIKEVFAAIDKAVS